MIARDRVQEAVDALYGGDPADFLPHRKELTAQARAAKDRDAAKAIAALRKPTRSAHLLNQLSLREPERVDALLRLTDSPDTGGGRSRRDALKAMRELTTRRRRLVDDLADRAFAGAGEDSPTTALRDEVVATLNAALGDPDVGTELAEGRLVRSHEWAGFGFSAADLALVPDDDPAETDDDRDDADEEDLEPDDQEGEDQPSGDDDELDDTEGDEPDEPEDDEDGDEDEPEEQEEDEEPEDDQPADDEDDDEDDVAGPITEAREVLRLAERDLKTQQRSEREQQDHVADLEDELAEAQIRLDEIRVAIRRAEMVQRRARTALERLSDR
ncbi:hypothetical protein FDO65_16135 [Nakamurella flava]|uniref:Uncharacterized protein n=1 Tax=Nakamurella flava TaxID=2576308 RepID=A0A4U6QCD3_9ACTN|nr:hypothetical protein [Nakamurella flava]TKV57680.1 hypothetical protein FDO65_16135 [Nakamurella flava]